MIGLTPRQAELLGFIRAYHGARSIMPCFREMMEALSIKSKGQLHKLLTALEDRDAILRVHGGDRAIVILGDDPPLSHASTAQLRAELARRTGGKAYLGTYPIRSHRTCAEIAA